MLIIRTVLADIAPDTLGICYPHEHLYGQPPPQFAEPDLLLTDESAASAEMRAFYDAGGRALVEMTTPDYGRDAGALQRIARASGVHIVAATGYNKEKFSAPFLQGASVDQLAARFAAEVTTGMDNKMPSPPTPLPQGEGSQMASAGVIKASSTLNEISPLAQTLFHAAATAHHATGAPISTHTEAGTMALEQVALLTGDGVDPARITIGHMDRKLDFAYHRDVAATGVYLGYDQIGKAKYYADSQRADLIMQMIDAGYGQQLLLAGDTARRRYWRANGGLGFTHILHSFVPLLRERGVSQAAVDDLLVHNPARALAFEPS